MCHPPAFAGFVGYRWLLIVLMSLSKGFSMYPEPRSCARPISISDTASFVISRYNEGLNGQEDYQLFWLRPKGWLGDEPTVGEKDVVIGVHGHRGSRGNFDELGSSLLRRGFHVLLVNFGDEESSAFHASMIYQQSNFVHNVLKQLCSPSSRFFQPLGTGEQEPALIRGEAVTATSCILAGHSMGGVVSALAITELDSRLVDGLILLSAPMQAHPSPTDFGFPLLYTDLHSRLQRLAEAEALPPVVLWSGGSGDSQVKPALSTLPSNVGLHLLIASEARTHCDTNHMGPLYCADFLEGIVPETARMMADKRTKAETEAMILKRATNPLESMLRGDLVSLPGSDTRGALPSNIMLTEWSSLMVTSSTGLSIGLPLSSLEDEVELLIYDKAGNASSPVFRLFVFSASNNPEFTKSGRGMGRKADCPKEVHGGGACRFVSWGKEAGVDTSEVEIATPSLAGSLKGASVFKVSDVLHGYSEKTKPLAAVLQFSCASHSPCTAFLASHPPSSRSRGSTVSYSHSFLPLPYLLKQKNDLLPLREEGRGKARMIRRVHVGPWPHWFRARVVVSREGEDGSHGRHEKDMGRRLDFITPVISGFSPTPLETETLGQFFFMSTQCDPSRRKASNTEPHLCSPQSSVLLPTFPPDNSRAGEISEVSFEEPIATFFVLFPLEEREKLSIEIQPLLLESLLEILVMYWPLAVTAWVASTLVLLGMGCRGGLGVDGIPFPERFLTSGFLCCLVTYSPFRLPQGRPIWGPFLADRPPILILLGLVLFFHLSLDWLSHAIAHAEKKSQDGLKKFMTLLHTWLQRVRFIVIEGLQRITSRKMPSRQVSIWTKKSFDVLPLVLFWAGVLYLPSIIGTLAPFVLLSSLRSQRISIFKRIWIEGLVQITGQLAALRLIHALHTLTMWTHSPFRSSYGSLGGGERGAWGRVTPLVHLIDGPGVAVVPCLLALHLRSKEGSSAEKEMWQRLRHPGLILSAVLVGAAMTLMGDNRLFLLTFYLQGCDESRRGTKASLLCRFLILCLAQLKLRFFGLILPFGSEESSSRKAEEDIVGCPHAQDMKDNGAEIYKSSAQSRFINGLSCSSISPLVSPAALPLNEEPTTSFASTCSSSSACDKETTPRMGRGNKERELRKQTWRGKGGEKGRRKTGQVAVKKLVSGDGDGGCDWG